MVEDCDIGYDKLYEALTYVGASYTTHDNMRCHTSDCMTFGLELIHAKSQKQKLNTKVSTESAVVRARNYIQFSMWLDIYMEHQRYRLKRNKLIQDNMSAIKWRRMVKFMYGEFPAHKHQILLC